MMNTTTYCEKTVKLHCDKLGFGGSPGVDWAEGIKADRAADVRTQLLAVLHNPALTSMEAIYFRSLSTEEYAADVTDRADSFAHATRRAGKLTTEQRACLVIAWDVERALGRRKAVDALNKIMGF